MLTDRFNPAPFPCSTIPRSGVSQASPAAIVESMLVERCRAGDAQAWGNLVGRYEKPVYRLAYSLCHNHEQSGDIVSQVLVRVFQGLDTFQSGRPFRTWVFRITRNVFIDVCVRRAHHHALSLNAFSNSSEDGTYLDRIADNPADLPHDTYLRAEAMRVIMAAIQALPEHQRAVVQMHHFDDMNYHEIASSLNVSVGTVKSRLHRARKTLRLSAYAP